MKTKFISSIIILISFFASCDQNPVVLQINDMIITKSEFQKMFLERKSMHESNHNSSFRKVDFEKWIDELYEKYLLIDYAHKLGYNKNKDLINDVDVYERAFLLQQGGEFYSVIVEDGVVVTPEEVDIGIKTIPFLYIFDVVEFNSLEHYNESIKNVNNNEITLENILKYNSSLKKYQVDDIWPFNLLLGNIETFSNMKINDQTDLLISYTNPYKPVYFIAKLRNKIKQSDEDVNSEFIGHNQYMYNCQLKFHKILYSFYEKSKMMINDSLIFYCYNKISQDTATYNINGSNVSNIFNEIALEYRINNEQKKVSIFNFIEYYNATPLKRNFYDSIDFKEYFIDILISDYKIDNAKQIGYFESNEMKKRRKNFFDSRCVDAFLKDSIETKIKINDLELESYYNDSIKYFTVSEYYSFDIIVFNSYSDALISEKVLQSFSNNRSVDYNNDSSLISKIIDIDKKENIPYSDISNNSIFKSLLNNSFTDIFQYKNFYAIAVITDIAGEYTIPFIEKKENIKDILFNQKYMNLIKIKLDDIKKSAIIKNNIKYSDYL